jgi:hypothetical protein
MLERNLCTYEREFAGSLALARRRENTARGFCISIGELGQVQPDRRLL